MPHRDNIGPDGLILLEALEIDLERDTDNRHSWHVARNGHRIGRVWQTNGLWHSGGQLTANTRRDAAFDLAANVPLESN